MRPVIAKKFGWAWPLFLMVGMGWGSSLQAQPSCTPTFYWGCVYNSYIADVSLAGFSRSSACDSPSGNNKGYVFWTADTIVLTKKAYYILEATNTPVTYQWMWYGAWIDADANGWDAADFIGSSPSSIGAGQTWVHAFQVAEGNGVSVWDTTYLRVLGRRFGSRIQASNYCLSWTYGEAEDYVVILKPASDTDLMLLSAYVGELEGCRNVSYPIRFVIANNGIDLPPGESIAYSVTINGVPACNGTYVLSDSLRLGELDTVTAACSAQFSSTGVKSISVSITYSADADASNNSRSASFRVLPVFSTPWAEGFEANGVYEPNSAGEDTLAVGWRVNPGGGASLYRWITEEDQTSSSGTGPDKPYAGSRYVFTEASYAGDDAILASSCLDISALNDPMLSFAYHMYGATMGTLYLEGIDSSGQWEILDSIVGEQHSSMGAPWSLRFASLAGKGSPYRIRFRGKRGVSFQSDMAVDEVKVYEFVDDIAVEDIIYPLNGCGLNSNTQPIFEIRNWGPALLPGTSIPFDVLINDSVACSGTATLADTLELGQTLQITGCGVDMSAYGTYDLDVVVNYPSDSVASNDTLSIFLNHTAAETAPWADGFEDNNVFEPNMLGEDTLANGWWLNPGGGLLNYRWMTEDGHLPSQNTGPATPYSGNRYIFVEASYSYRNREAIIESPCVDLSSLSTPTLSFAYHMYGQGIGDLFIELYTPQGWIRVDSIMGAQHQSATDPWSHAFIDLSTYGNFIKARFRAVNHYYVYNYSQGDISIDSVRFYDPPVDVAAHQMLRPVDECALDSVQVEFSVVNVGALLDSGEVLYYTILLNGANACTDSFMIGAGGLGSGKDSVIVSSCSYNVSSPGTYQVTIVVTHSADVNPANDTLRAEFQHIPYVSNFPYVEDFEQSRGGWRSYSIDNGANDWEWGEPDDMPSSAINSAAGGVKAWETWIMGQYSPGSNSAVESPCFDFSNITDSIEVVFYIYSDGYVYNSSSGISYGYSGAVLDTATSRSGIWGKVGTSSDPDWYNIDVLSAMPWSMGDRSGWGGPNTGWRKVRRVLPLAGLDTARFRIHFVSITSTYYANQYDGFAFDSFMVGPKGFEYCMNNPLTPFPQLVMDDTAYVNSPHRLALAYPSQAAGQFWWYVNGVLVGRDRMVWHTFTQLGTDTVTLISKTCQGWDTTSKTVTVVTPTRPPVANFSGSPLAVEVGGVVNLADLSLYGPTSWTWWIEPAQFYDPVNGYFLPTGVFSPSNTDPTPQLAMIAPGSYRVCLAVANSLGSDTLCIDDYVAVLESAEMCSNDSSTSLRGFLYDDGGKSGTYSSNQNCDYLITPCVEEVELTLHEMNLLSGDYLRIYDGRDNTGIKLWDLNTYTTQGMTGSISNPLHFTATSGTVYVEFESNSWGVDEGFRLEWEGKNPLSMPVAGISGADTLCAGVSGLFIYNGGSTDASIGWDTTGDTIPDVYGLTLDVLYATPGTYQIIQMVNNCAGGDTAYHTVVVTGGGPQLFGFAISGGPSITSTGEEVSLSAVNVQGCILGWEWHFVQGGQPVQPTYVMGDSSSGVVKVTFSDTGCVDVTLIGYGVSDTDTVTAACFVRVLDYCMPLSTTTSPTVGISRFVTGSIDHTSPAGTTTYSDYSRSRSTDVERGQTYSFTVYRGGSQGVVYYKLWADWDLNGVFDADEEIAYSGAVSGASWSSTFTVPVDVASGPIRLRVGISNSGTFTACGPVFVGEYEDYSLNVLPDMTPPMLWLLGGDTVAIEECDRWVDPGYVAWDAVDDTLTSQVQVLGMVDTSMIGEYTLRYVVSDHSGNVSDTLVRVVRVISETTPPVVQLLGPLYVEHDVKTSYEDSGYVAWDDCSGVGQVDTVSTVDEDVLGLYRYGYVVWDARGNVDSVYRLVDVVDREAPVLTLLGPVSDTIRRLDPYVDAGYTVTDNYYPVSSLDVDTLTNLDVTKEGVYYYNYVARDPSGNVSDPASRVVVVISALGVGDVDLGPGVRLLANPVREGMLYLDYGVRVALGGARVEDLSGRVLLDLEGGVVRSGVVGYDVSRLPSGSYVLRVWNDEGVRLVRFSVVK